MALGSFFAVLGSALLYLASPNQRWRARPLPAPLAPAAGGLALVASLLAFHRATSVLPGLFTFVSVVMLALVVITYAGALARPRRDR